MLENDDFDNENEPMTEKEHQDMLMFQELAQLLAPTIEELEIGVRKDFEAFRGFAPVEFMCLKDLTWGVSILFFK